MMGTVKDYWINSARYDWWQARYAGHIIERIFYNLKIRRILSFTDFRNKYILDLGCATGVNTNDFYKQSKNTFGIDISKWAIEKARQKSSHINYQVMDSENISFKDNSFDIIVMTGIIQYLEKPEASINEVYRLLKPGGFLIVEVPWKYSVYNNIFLRRLITGKENPNDEPINRVYSSKQLKILLKRFECLRMNVFLVAILLGLFQKSL